MKNNDDASKTTIPEEIMGFSWGACFLNGIWGVGNRTYGALLAFLPVLNIIMMPILGLYGRKWAWKNKHWESVEHFNNVQKKWDIAGFIAFGIYILVVLKGMIEIVT
jgi:hypothetical protein